MKYITIVTLCLTVCNTGLLMTVVDRQKTYRQVPVNSRSLNLEFALGERVLVMDYDTRKPKHEIVEGTVTGWGITDFELTGKEEVVYFVSTSSEHSAHGYKAKEIRRT